MAPSGTLKRNEICILQILVAVIALFQFPLSAFAMGGEGIVAGIAQALGFVLLGSFAVGGIAYLFVLHHRPNLIGPTCALAGIFALFATLAFLKALPILLFAIPIAAASFILLVSIMLALETLWLLVSMALRGGNSRRNTPANSSNE